MFGTFWGLWTQRCSVVDLGQDCGFSENLGVSSPGTFCVSVAGHQHFWDFFERCTVTVSVATGVSQVAFLERLGCVSAAASTGTFSSTPEFCFAVSVATSFFFFFNPRRYLQEHHRHFFRRFSTMRVCHHRHSCETFQKFGLSVGNFKCRQLK